MSKRKQSRFGGARVGAGRPKTADPKSEQLQIRLTVGERAELTKKAGEAELTLGRWIVSQLRTRLLVEDADE